MAFAYMYVCPVRILKTYMCRLTTIIMLSTVFITLILYQHLHGTKKVRSTLLLERAQIMDSTRPDQAEVDTICISPQLQHNHTSVMKFYKHMTPVECGIDTNWVFVKNGTFQISEEAIAKHGNISCCYVPIIREDSDFEIKDGKLIDPMPNGTLLTTDFFKVTCSAADGESYFNIHSGIGYNNATISRFQRSSLPSGAMGLNILILGYDSISRMSWLRNLPKTHDYFTKTLKGVVLEGYNIVGDGTPAALLPILTGQTEEELPEARRGEPGVKPVDGHPWIWNKFKDIGYVTQFIEDMTSIGCFTYRMLGFTKQPVDHYMRPFYLAAEPHYNKYKTLCLGSTRRHVNMLNYVRDMYHMYIDKPKFTFMFHAEYSHDDFNKPQLADEDQLELLRYLEDNGYLDKTLVIMMADHGARFQHIRESLQGKFEERLPYFGLRFPPWFQKRYPYAYENFQNNVHRLTTPFDIHETLKDIINYKGGFGEKRARGMSLFSEIPKDRTCKDADVQPHWCACLKWDELDHEDTIAKSAAQSVVNFINDITEPHRDLCEKLSLLNITYAIKLTANKDVLRFKGSSDKDGRVPDLSGQTVPKENIYQVTFRTSPGNGLFEATVKYITISNQFVANKGGLSRINRYGDAPRCIMKRIPLMRPYCYCKHD